MNRVGHGLFNITGGIMQASKLSTLAIMALNDIAPKPETTRIVLGQYSFIMSKEKLNHKDCVQFDDVLSRCEHLRCFGELLGEYCGGQGPEFFDQAHTI